MWPRERSIARSSTTARSVRQDDEPEIHPLDRAARRQGETSSRSTPRLSARSSSTSCRSTWARVHGYQTRFHLYTVPGQVLYERTRVAVLNGADGVVFVGRLRSAKAGRERAVAARAGPQPDPAGQAVPGVPDGDAVQQARSRHRLAREVMERYLNSMHVPRLRGGSRQGRRGVRHPEGDQQDGHRQIIAQAAGAAPAPLNIMALQGTLRDFALLTLSN